jgi:acylphosphatase
MVRKRAHLLIEGRVQGVFYRQSMKKIAEIYGVSGWVRNLFTGDVEAIVEGDEDGVNHVIDWCRIGPENARIDEVLVNWQKPLDETSLFIVKG